MAGISFREGSVVSELVNTNLTGFAKLINRPITTKTPTLQVCESSEKDGDRYVRDVPFETHRLAKLCGLMLSNVNFVERKTGAAFRVIDPCVFGRHVVMISRGPIEAYNVLTHNGALVIGIRERAGPLLDDAATLSFLQQRVICAEHSFPLTAR